MVGRSAEVQTHGFFMNTREYIDDLAADPTTKLDYQDALYAYLRNENSTTTGVFDFAEQALPSTLRDSYIEYMRARQLSETTVMKNTELIKSKLKRRTMHFSTGVRLVRGN